MHHHRRSSGRETARKISDWQTSRIHSLQGFRYVLLLFLTASHMTAFTCTSTIHIISQFNTIYQGNISWLNCEFVPKFYFNSIIVFLNVSYFWYFIILSSFHTINNTTRGLQNSSGVPWLETTNSRRLSMLISWRLYRWNGCGKAEKWPCGYRKRKQPWLLPNTVSHSIPIAPWFPIRTSTILQCTSRGSSILRTQNRTSWIV